MSRTCFLLAAVVLTGCGPKVKSQVKVALDPLPPDQDVMVFATDLPECAYEVVGIIASDDLEATKKRARKLGADGVIGTVLAGSGSSASRAGACGTPNCVQFNTVAIRFTDPGCTN
jgi:hypothetical protein